MTAGPAWLAAAWPVSTKIPAPITAPTPSRMRCLAVRVRFSVASPSRLPSMGSPASTCPAGSTGLTRSEEHTSELQSQSNLVCRLLLEKKKKKIEYEYRVYRDVSNSMVCAVHS